MQAHAAACPNKYIKPMQMGACCDLARIGRRSPKAGGELRLPERHAHSRCCQHKMGAKRLCL